MSSPYTFDIDVDPSTGVFDNKTQVPEEILSHIPSSATVSALLEHSFPSVLMKASVGSQASKCVTDHATSWTAEELFKAPIPQSSWVFSVGTILRERLATTSSVSVRHPKVTNLYLPPWVINFWYSYEEAAKQRKKWSKAKDWIFTWAGEERASEAIELMERIPWGMRIWALGSAPSSYVGVLAELLSADFVGERHLDVVASYLNFRASKDNGGAVECWAGDVCLLTYVKEVYARRKTTCSSESPFSTHSGLKKYQEAITMKGYKRLILPANVNENHWVGFGVDLVERQFRWGIPSLSL